MVQFHKDSWLQNEHYLQNKYRLLSSCDTDPLTIINKANLVWFNLDEYTLIENQGGLRKSKISFVTPQHDI